MFNVYDIFSCNTYFIKQNLILKNPCRTAMTIDKQVTECYGHRNYGSISSTTASFCTDPYNGATGGGQNSLHERLLQRNRLTPIEDRRCTRHLPISQQRGTMAAIGLFGSTSLTGRTQRPQRSLSAWEQRAQAIETKLPSASPSYRGTYPGRTAPKVFSMHPILQCKIHAAHVPMASFLN